VREPIPSIYNQSAWRMWPPFGLKFFPKSGAV
jgi:hypothetical protein